MPSSITNKVLIKDLDLEFSKQTWIRTFQSSWVLMVEGMFYQRLALTALQLFNLHKYLQTFSTFRVKECSKNTWRRKVSWSTASSKKTIWSHSTAHHLVLTHKSKSRLLLVRILTLEISTLSKMRRPTWVQDTIKMKMTSKTWSKSSIKWSHATDKALMLSEWDQTSASCQLVSAPRPTERKALTYRRH